MTERFLNYQILNVITGFWALERAHGAYRMKFPNSLLHRLSKIIDFDEKKILHLFCGSSTFGTIRVDINPEVKPDFLLDLRKEKLPFLNNSFDIVLADPPYFDFPPYCFVAESVRVLKPNGFLIILHHLVYKNPKGCRRWAVLGISCGPNHRVRALNVWRKNKSS